MAGMNQVRVISLQYILTVVLKLDRYSIESAWGLYCNNKIYKKPSCR